LAVWLPAAVYSCQQKASSSVETRAELHHEVVVGPIADVSEHVATAPAD